VITLPCLQCYSFVFQVALLLALHAVVLLVPVVWTYPTEGIATVIKSALTTITIPIPTTIIPATTAALTIPVKVM